MTSLIQCMHTAAALSLNQEIQTRSVGFLVTVKPELSEMALNAQDLQLLSTSII